LEKKAILPTVSSCAGFRTGSSEKAYRKKLKTIYNEETSKQLIKNGIKGNPVLFEFIMGWPINWTSLKPLKKIMIPRWNKKNLLKIKPLSKKKFQKNRVRAIGNGQVPLCVYSLLKLWLFKE